jgi:hypothetical protein
LLRSSHLGHGKIHEVITGWPGSFVHQNIDFFSKLAACYMIQLVRIRIQHFAGSGVVRCQESKIPVRSQSGKSLVMEPWMSQRWRQQRQQSQGQEWWSSGCFCP